MADDNNAQFEEVLEISIHVQAFQDSINEIKAIWDDFVAGLGDESAAGVVGAGMFSSLKDQLEEISDKVGIVYSEIVDGAQTTSDAVASSVDATDQAQEAAAQKQRARSSANAEAELSNIAAMSAARKELGQNIEGPKEEKYSADFSPKQQPEHADIAAEVQGAEDRYAELYAEAGEMNRQFNAEAEASDEQLNLRRVRNAEEAMEQIQEIANAENARRDEEAEASDEQLNMRRVRNAEEAMEQIQEIANAENARRDEEAEASDEQLNMRRVRNAEEAMEQIQEIANAENARRDEEAEASDEQLNMRRVRNAEEAMEAIQIKALEMDRARTESQERQNAASNSGMDLGLARVAKFVILWRVVGAVIGEVTKLLESPFEALKDGVTYIHELQAQADELRGVLQANVQFSADLTENFRQASQVAPLVVRALQDAAIATHTKPEQLTNIFKSLADNGAAGGVKDTQQLVDLATQLGIAFKASGASVQSVQRAISEIPKFLEGALPHGSKLLQVLDLSSDAAAKLVKEGLQYGDLLERVTALPSMQAHAKAVSAMKDDWQSAYANLQMYISRLEAAGSSELAETLGAWLRELNDWISKNSDKLAEGLKAFASVLTNLATAVAKTVFELGSVAQVPTWLLVLGTTVNAVATGFGTLAAGMKYVHELGQALVDPDSVLKDPKKYAGLSTGSKRDFAFDRAKQDFQEDMGANSQQGFRTQMAINGTPLPEGAYVDPDTGSVVDIDRATAGPNSRARQPGGIFYTQPMHAPITGKHEDRTESPKQPGYAEPGKEMSEEKTAIFSAVDAIKNKYKELNEATAESVASRTMSHRDAANAVKANAAKEIAELDRQKTALDMYYYEAVTATEALPASGKKQEQQRADAVLALTNGKEASDTHFDDAKGAINKTVSTYDKAADSEDYTLSEEHFKHLQAIQEEAGAKSLAYDKLLAAEGYLTKTQAFDRETAVAAQTNARLLALDDEQIAHFANDTDVLSGLQDKRALDAIKGVDAAALRAEQRKEIEAQRVQEQVKQQAEVRAQQYSSAETSAGIDDETSGGSSEQAEERSLSALKQRDLELAIREKEAAFETAAARNYETEATRALSRELTGLYEQREKDLQARLAQRNKNVAPEWRSQIDRPLLQQNVDSAQHDVSNAVGSLEHFNSTHESGDAASAAENGQRQALQDAINKATDALTVANTHLATQDSGAAEIRAWGAKTGGFADMGKAKEADANDGGGLTGADAEIAAGAQDVATAFKGVVNAAAEYEAGYKQGGVLGGAGSVMSANAGLIGGLMTNLGSASGPLVGSIIGAVGGILSTVGALFTAAAAHIATVIQQQATITMAAYQNQTVDLANTLVAMQQQEADAISQLSGVKGGQAELTKILPGLQSTIASLQQQVNTTLANFNASLESLNEQSSALTGINQQWVQINQTVADYLAAGGSAANAAQYLSQSLEQLQITTQDTLTQANDKAVQDAISLNGLLQQKLQLTEQYNQQVFETTNEGSIQRTAGAVEQGMQLDQITAQYNAQLVSINAQISLATQQVAAESQIFNIATNINDLHVQDAALQMQQLGEQLALYQQMESIVKGITDNGGVYSAAPGTFNALPTTIVVELQLAGYTLTATGQLNSNGTVVGTAGATGSSGSGVPITSDSLATALQQQARMSPL